MREFPISFARSLLLKDGQEFLERLGQKVAYEINIGYNGKVWVSASKPKDTIFIFQALQRLLEYGNSTENIDFIFNALG